MKPVRWKIMAMCLWLIIFLIDHTAGFETGQNISEPNTNKPSLGGRDQDLKDRLDRFEQNMTKLDTWNSFEEDRHIARYRRASNEACTSHPDCTYPVKYGGQTYYKGCWKGNDNFFWCSTKQKSNQQQKPGNWDYCSGNCKESIHSTFMSKFLGPYDHTWSNEQCSVIETIEGGSLEDCMTQCVASTDPRCTAVSYKDLPDEACVLRACAVPVPPPEWNHPPYYGYPLITDFFITTSALKGFSTPDYHNKLYIEEETSGAKQIHFSVRGQDNAFVSLKQNGSNHWVRILIKGWTSAYEGGRSAVRFYSTADGSKYITKPEGGLDTVDDDISFISFEKFIIEISEKQISVRKNGSSEPFLNVPYPEKFPIKFNPDEIGFSNYAATTGVNYVYWRFDRCGKLSGCDEIENCQKDNAGYNKCHCKEGFKGDSYEGGCKDIDECEDNKGDCEYMCNNNVGSYNCSCNIGFDLKMDNKTCKDIDECVDDNGHGHDCAQNCTNTFGSYTCTCWAGYTLMKDAKNCTDIDECEGNYGRGNCEDYCINSPGSFSCTCRDGFMLNLDNKSCIDIDECDGNDGRGVCEHNCTNSVGTYNCSCQEGFNLKSDKRACQDEATTIPHLYLLIIGIIALILILAAALLCVLVKRHRGRLPNDAQPQPPITDNEPQTPIDDDQPQPPATVFEQVHFMNDAHQPSVHIYDMI